MNDHAALLRQHFLFQGAEELLSDALALGAERFSRGETICDPATAERALGIVLEGRAEAVAPTRERAVLAAFSRSSPSTKARTTPTTVTSARRAKDPALEAASRPHRAVRGRAPAV